MSSYSLSNVLLPAVFVSSTVFSALTVPFALIKSEPVLVEIPPIYSGEIQPIFDGEHKDVAIPYVGFAIVASVGAGIACVEIHRRWHNSRVSEQEESQQNLQASLKEVQPETLNQPEYRPEVSAIEFPLKDEEFKNQPLDIPDVAIHPTSTTIAAPEDRFESSPLGFPSLTLPKTNQLLASGTTKTAIATLSSQLNTPPIAQETQSLQLAPDSASALVVVQETDPAIIGKVLESRSLYQTCRIKVPHLERRLFAIRFEGQYYSFLRAEKTKEKVLQIMANLEHQLAQTVITETEKGYIIWNLEPEVSTAIS